MFKSKAISFHVVNKKLFYNINNSAAKKCYDMALYIIAPDKKHYQRCMCKKFNSILFKSAIKLVLL